MSLCVCALSFTLGALAGESPKDPKPPSNAEKKAEAKAKTRTLKELTALVLQGGGDFGVSPETADCLGFGRVETPTKSLRYKRKVSPDNKEHSFCVVTRQSPSGKRTANALVWIVVTAEKTGDEIRVDGLNLKLSLDGKLEAACRNKGKPGDIVPEPLSTSSAEVRRLYEQERDLYFKMAPKLALEFVP